MLPRKNSDQCQNKVKLKISIYQLTQAKIKEEK